MRGTGSVNRRRLDRHDRSGSRPVAAEQSVGNPVSFLASSGSRHLPDQPEDP